MKRLDVVDEIARLFALRGGSMYGGEGVTQLEHALQAAALAEASGADAATIAAALLHDVGHVLHNLPDDAPDKGIDDVHEELGYRWLTKHLVPRCRSRCGCTSMRSAICARLNRDTKNF